VRLRAAIILVLTWGLTLPGQGREWPAGGREQRGAVDSALITVLANLGTGGVVIVLIVLGYLIPKPAYAQLLEENEKLKDALALERQRADDASRAGEVTNQLIGGIIRLAGYRDEAPRDRPPPGAGQVPVLELSAENPGLS